VLEAGDGGVVALSAKSVGNARTSSFNRHHPGSGIDGRREVISNAAKATMLGNHKSRGCLRVFPPRLAVIGVVDGVGGSGGGEGGEDVVYVDEGYSPPTLGGGIPWGRFSLLPMNNQ
jgi:hypothetical protein